MTDNQPSDNVAIHDQTTLGDLIVQHPELASTLEALNLDYCCGGQQTLTTACSVAGIDLATTLETLNATPLVAEPAEWASLDMAALADHVETVHHAYLHDALPRLGDLAEKVAGVHGENHPELIHVQQTYAALRADLEPHLMKEERVLFPMIRELAAATSAPSFHCGTLANPISAMAFEHEQAGELLAKLRQLTDNYTAPSDACGSYRALYSGLAELETDTHQHIHKENHVLFPNAMRQEQAMSQG